MPARAAYTDDIGYTELQTELGSSIPKGASVSVTQTEAPDGSGNYLPDATISEFSGKALNAKSGASGVSLHATMVGQYYYGSVTSTAPGIPTIDVYNANGWIVSGFLNYGSTALPLRENRALQNHSWIGTIDNGGPDDLEALERFDYAMQTSGFLAMTGLNNGNDTTIPVLLSSACDSISVGLTNGNHSTGTTTTYGAGRIKPEIVAPHQETSFATPMVGAAAAFLLDAINGISAYANAGKNVTLKAILLAGATKSPFSGWSRTTSRPLDSHYGAGQLNIYNSYHILAAGRQAASGSASVRSRGWDFATTTAAGKFYFFDVAAGDTASNFSALLTWNIKITTTGGRWLNATSTLPALTLNLYSATNFTVGALADSSVSSVDNLQHLYEPNLPPGRYALQVTGDTGVSYGLAWLSLPSVTLAAGAPDAYEQGHVPGTFILTRAGETLDPLTVHYTIGGSAVDGSDYEAISGVAVIPAGAASVAINITPTTYPAPRGDQTVTLTLANDLAYSVGAGSADTVTIHDLPYNNWLIANFTPDQRADSSTSGPNADPDHDGIPNLLEYALNLIPTSPDPAGVPVIGQDLNGQPTFTYTQMKSATDITYLVELSPDLASWGSGSLAVTQVADHGDTQAITVVSQLPVADNPRQFFHLKVTRP